MCTVSDNNYIEFRTVHSLLQELTFSLIVDSIQKSGKKKEWVAWEVSHLCKDKALIQTEIYRTWLCKRMIHFPLGYLVMGKNAFSWINDMFIRKEVATLSEALPVPTLPSHSS